jgi:GntR family transcriptional repressor for pyruvate dehydrogenase complex
MFAPLPRHRASDQVAGAVRDRILGGELSPGERLPSERDLAAQLGVNRTTVREALRALEQLGLVSIRHGGGAVVQDYTRAGLQVLPYLLSPGGTLDLELLGSFLEVRHDMGVAIARRAAERAGDDSVERLSAALAAIEEAAARGGGAVPPATLAQLDVAFFEALTRAAGNRVYAFVLHALRRVVVGYGERAPELLGTLFADAGRTLTCHRTVLAAVRARDGVAASAAVHRYLAPPAAEPGRGA